MAQVESPGKGVRVLRSLRLFLFVALIAAALVPASPAVAATITVTTTADEYATGAGCSLREAIKTANDDIAFDGCSLVGGGEDIITVPAGQFTLTRPGTGEDAGLDGDLDITDSVTIVGAGARATIVDGNRTVTEERVFDILGSGDTVTIGDLTVRNGVGGILVGQATTTLNVLRATFSGNTNRGIRNFGPLNVTDVTFSGNTIGAGGSGGALAVGGPTTLTNVTFSGNSAGTSGGAIWTEASLTINNATIVRNTADIDGDGGDGGGIYWDAGTTTLRNTILADNADSSAATKHPDCSGPLTSDGYNLIEDTTGCSISGTQVGDVTGSDPGLGPLQDNGGPTDTHALPSTSPAFDAGNPAPPGSGPLACIATDQRGVARPQFTRCDIGAFELQPTPTPTPTPTPAPTPQPPAMCLGRNATIQGTNGPDRLTGTGKADVIAGLGGDDTIRGLGGKDRICAGAGDDRSSGQGGADQIRGEAGDDRLKGQGGGDTLKGGAGEDHLAGGGGNDRCRGGPGQDEVSNCE
jgi:CSLREA domain-containing protein